MLFNSLNLPSSFLSSFSCIGLFSKTIESNRTSSCWFPVTFFMRVGITVSFPIDVFYRAWLLFRSPYWSSKVQAEQKTWLWTSICINLGFLMVFKYYNFFAETFAVFWSGFGFKIHPATLDIILPVGISFYTFHGLSYIIDVYKNKITAERNIVDYSLFVSFFPLLVAGPIERATHLLPQIKRERTYNYNQLADGLRQILWGLFKKILIADNCAMYSYMILNDPHNYGGSTLALGAVFFAVQIYADFFFFFFFFFFSGYSDIALGTARLLGIDLLQNFAFPYFSRDMAEFWRRWHISLTTWFRDYLYIPLGGSRGSVWKKIRNTCIVFLVSGFWHGAIRTFIVWGLLHACFFIPLLLINKNRTNLNQVAEGRILPSFREILSMTVTFILVTFAWIFFRAPDISSAWIYIERMFTKSLFSKPTVLPMHAILMVTIFFIIEWFGRSQHYAIAQLGLRLPYPVRWGIYLLMCIAIVVMAGRETPFIYFNFWYEKNSWSNWHFLL